MKLTIKTYTDYFLILLLGCSITSCKKLLEIPPNPADRISTAQAFSDSGSVQSVIAGIYTAFAVQDYGFPAIHNGGLTVYTGLSGDELISRETQFDFIRVPFYANNLRSDNALLDAALWIYAYKNIYLINSSLQGINASTGLSTGLKKRLTGELKTVRAMNYFNLVNIFGGVPVITGTDYRINATIPRATEEKVYEQIVADLEDALNLLVPEYPSAGHARPNLYTAEALLAKVYLYLENWQKASELTGDIIDAGIYSLEPDLNNVFLDGSTEAIWQHPVTADSYVQTTEAVLFVPLSPGEQPKFELTRFLLDDFETDDQRRVNWVTEVEANSVIYPIPYKYKNIDNNGSTLEGYTFFRLGEMYLIRAEARAHLDQYSDALDDLNEIRGRAGLADKTFSTKDNLLADIMQERRIELFCEWGNRWYDLKRTGTIDAVLDPVKPGWDTHDALYPIPLEEIKSNPFLKQNPGY